MMFNRGKESRGKNIRREKLINSVTALILALMLILPQVAEARPISVATPAVIIAPSSVMIGEDFDFLVTFDNTGSPPATSTGYGPFIDLVFPYTGYDGDDGIEYNSSSYLGATLEDDIQFFPDQGGGWGCVSHPWLRDNNGDYVDVCGNAGDQYVSIRLPFGSFTADQPRLDITVNAHLSIDADVPPPGPGLLIYGRGGFMFGETPEDDWCCGDVPVVKPQHVDRSHPGTVRYEAGCIYSQRGVSRYVRDYPVSNLCPFPPDLHRPLESSYRHGCVACEKLHNGEHGHDGHFSPDPFTDQLEQRFTQTDSCQNRHRWNHRHDKPVKREIVTTRPHHEGEMAHDEQNQVSHDPVAEKPESESQQGRCNQNDPSGKQELPEVDQSCRYQVW
jgi:hypothetical protein